MLKRDKKDKEEYQGEVGSHAAFIGPTHMVKGEVSGEEDLVLKGYVKGKIDLKNHSLIIEKGGRVDGDVIANNLTLRGLVNGNIYASGKVFVAPEAHMRGDIAANRISISDGAIFKGAIKMEEGFEQIFSPKEKAEPRPPKDKPKEKEKEKDESGES